MEKLKNNLASIAALIAAIVAIGGGFVKYGELTTKLTALENQKGVNIAPLQEEVKQLQIDLKSLSTKVTRAAPRDKHSIPNDPIPQ